MKIMTFKMHLTDKLSKKEINHIASKYGIQGKNTDLEFIRKGTTPFTLGDLKFDVGERSVIKTITTAAKDRDDEIILPSGLILDHYLKQPIVLPGHDYKGLGVGRSEWIKSTQDGYALLQKTKYGPTKLADDYWKWQRDGFPLAASIGFVPIKAVMTGDKEFKELSAVLIDKGWSDKTTMEHTKRIYTKALLLEVSDVAVPSNQEATTVAVAKGIVPCHKSVCKMGEEEREQIIIGQSAEDTRTESEDSTHGPRAPEGPQKGLEEPNAIEKDETLSSLSSVDALPVITENEIRIRVIEETENEIRIRIRDPKDFQDGSFRRKTLKKDKPRVFAVIGKLKGEDKTTVQGLRFPKEDDWDIPKASKWAKEHDFKTIDWDTLELLQKWQRENEPIFKSVDEEGLPSTGDIERAIHTTLSNAIFMLKKSFFIVELYPVDYPNGHCVVVVWDDNTGCGPMSGPSTPQHFMDYSYVYDHSTKLVALGEGREVQEVWVVKSLEEKLTKLLAMEMKEGRVLSRKNRSLVEQAYKALGALIEADTKRDSKDDSEVFEGGQGDKNPPKKMTMTIPVGEEEVEEDKGNGKVKMTVEEFKSILDNAMGSKIEEASEQLKKDMNDKIALARGEAVYE